METMNAFTPERRHIPDRRTSHSRAITFEQMNALDWAALTLMIIGGINWGLVGLFNFNLVEAVFGELSAISRIIYTLVGISAVYSIYGGVKIAGNRPS
jgi:hypothetical protein